LVAGRNLSCVDFTVKSFRQAISYFLNTIAADLPSPDLRLGPVADGWVRQFHDHLVGVVGVQGD